MTTLPAISPLQPRFSSTQAFQVTTTDKIDGHKVAENLGVVNAALVTSRNAARDMFAGVTGMFGGEQENYTQMVNEMQQTCLQRLVEEAKKRGANALLGVRYATTNMSGNFAELAAYGTAVKLSKSA